MVLRLVVMVSRRGRNQYKPVTEQMIQLYFLARRTR